MVDLGSDINRLQQLMAHNSEQTFDLVPRALAKIIKERQWEGRLDAEGRPFQSFEAFAAHPVWHGLETRIDDLRRYCVKHPEVEQLILDAMEPGREHRGSTKEELDRDSNATSIGRGATYTLKRLKRDRPDLFKRVTAGEMSANAAAIA